MKRKHVIIFTFFLALIAIPGAFYQRYRATYPFGKSHCCDIGLQFKLMDYAQAHHGFYPSGEATPEASLSLTD